MLSEAKKVMWCIRLGLKGYQMVMFVAPVYFYTDRFMPYSCGEKREQKEENENGRLLVARSH